MRRIYGAIRKNDRFIFTLWLVWIWIRHRQKVVIVRRMEAIGDVVCTIPLVEYLKKRHPDSLVIALTSATCRRLFSFTVPRIDAFGAFSGDFCVASGFLGIVEIVYDVKAIEERGNQGSKVHLVKNLASSCGVYDIQSIQPRLTVRKKARERFQGSHPILAGESFVVINPGPTWPVRNWPASSWQQLIDRIRGSNSGPIVQIGGRRAAGPTEYDSLTGVYSLVGQLRVDELVVLISMARFVISIDSGPIHIAGAVGTPVVGLYGALNPSLYLPSDSPAVGIHSNVPCLFCHHQDPIGHWRSGCPQNVACMSQLSPDAVIKAMEKLLCRS